ncbi:CorA metal ion transporter [Gryganskiella cystojenkinii]|nr:CorA metal ion transporter [Gryganskiella cystojenkinii]
MSPSPVPLHARLSKLQNKRERTGKDPKSFHYGPSELPSGQTYPSRRHSIAEEDVCFPPESADLDVDYELLEEYLVKVKKQASGALKEIVENESWSDISYANRIRPYSSTSRLFSKRRRSTNYGSISDPPFELPRNFGLLHHAQEMNQTLTENAFRFTLFSTSSVTVHAKSLFELAPEGQTLTAVLQTGFFWLDILSPTDDEVRTLSLVFKIHPLTTEDILMEEGREKYSDGAQVLQPSSIYMLILPDGIISFHSLPIQHCQNVRKRIRHLKEKMEVTPDWINYAMIDDIVDAFAPLIRQVEAEVDMIDELVLMLKEADQSDMLRRIGNCRKRVMSLLRLLTGKADVIKGLIKRYEGEMRRKSTNDVGLFLGDIQDHIITMIQNLSHCEKILSRSHSNYLAQINIEMTAASNETNNVLTKLTAIGSIMLPMNLVTGLWGMNVPVPGQESQGLSWFFTIVTAILCTASLFILIARKTKLL